MPIPIVAPPSAPLAVVRLNAVRLGAADWWLHAVVALWDAGLATGVDPVVMAAQCAHETGWGAFGGAVTPDHGNTAGLKIRNPAGDSPDDHARFAISPDGLPRVGALAHAYHLRLYCGMPVPPDTPDPRAVWIGPGTKAYGTVRHVEDLGGKWAPAADYGTKVAAAYTRLVTPTT